MTVEGQLRVDHLRLQNFRCFTECTLELHPDLTVLVAENGHGKTAILDGVAIALGLFVAVPFVLVRGLGAEISNASASAGRRSTEL